MSPNILKKIVALSFCSVVLLGSRSGSARLEQRLDYSKTQSFQAALRYLRVDHGYVVIEKDQESGYLLFEYPKRDSGITQGSIEVVERDKSVALVVQLPQMPSYHERMLIDGLLKKLRDDYGAPPAREPAPKAPKKDTDEPSNDEQPNSPDRPKNDQGAQEPNPPQK